VISTKLGNKRPPGEKPTKYLSLGFKLTKEGGGTGRTQGVWGPGHSSTLGTLGYSPRGFQDTPRS